MIDESSTLSDVCFAAWAALDAGGTTGVLTGESAAALCAPRVYMSYDADFILTGNEPLSDVSVALRPIGFERSGRSRIYVHVDSKFTIDFPMGPLAVGRDYIHETHVLERGAMRLRILTRIDCIRDRLAHFYYWEDYSALNAAVGVAAVGIDQVDMAALRSWTERESPALLSKRAEFERRLAQSRNAL